MTSSRTNRGLCAAVAGALALLAPAKLSAAETQPEILVLKVGRIYTMTGDPIERGLVIVRDGRIESVGRDLAVPAGAQVIELPDAVLTPGLIDACCAVDSEIPQAATGSFRGSAESGSFWNTLAATRTARPAAAAALRDIEPEEDFPDDLPSTALSAGDDRPPEISWAEQSSEVTPQFRVLDAANLFSNDFVRLVKGGVTTVYVSPDSANVIGARGAIVKTAGPLDRRIVRPADAVKASLGVDPIYRGGSNNTPPRYGPPPNFRTRRPTTRMGVEWVFRKAFYDALRTRAGQSVHGADAPPAEAVPVLLEVLDGQVPLRFQARMQQDIVTALRLAAEFKLRFVLEEATEAYRCLPELRAGNVPVIFGPLFMTPSGWRAETGETHRPRLNAPQQLVDAGLELALTAQELRDEAGLVRQAMVAARHGLAADQALRAITSTPAKLLGLSGELGVVAPGARADLVAWSTEPLEAASRVVLVLIDGQIVYRPESD